MHFQFKISPGNYGKESHYFGFDKKHMCFNYKENCKSFMFYNIKNVIIGNEQLENKNELKYLDGYNLKLNFEMFKCNGESEDGYLQNNEYKKDNYFAMPDIFKLIHVSIEEIEEYIHEYEDINLEFDYDESKLICEWENYTFRPDHW